METNVKISKVDEVKRLAYGEVYIPMIPDSQGDFMTASTVEKIAHKFLKNGFVENIDLSHDLEKSGVVVVESFIARKDDPDFIEGSWVLGVFVEDDDTWESVKKGDFGGFSMSGTGTKEQKIIEIEIPESGILKGDTQPVDDGDHIHEYEISFSDEGVFLGGATSENDDHAHLIKQGTVTEEANGHRHRFNFIEALIPDED